jgi:thiol-disulfide isomerase/thioredoxin
MKLFTLTLGLLFISNLSFSQNREINFDGGSFADLKAKAKKENKLIFIDAYTTWCGPCKWMAKNIFTNDTVADYFNAKFINAKIDMEKGEGMDIAQAYTVQCYPNYLFLDGEGNLVHRFAGSMGAKEFIAGAENSLDSKKQFAHFTREYETKKTDSKFLAEYIQAIAGTCLDYEEILTTYFTNQKEEDLSNRTNWKLLFNFSNNYKSREFTYMLKHIDVYQKKYTADSVNMKIKYVLMQSAQGIIYNKNSTKADFDLYLKDVSNLDYSEKESILFEANLMNYQAKKDWVKYAELASSEGDKYITGIQKINSVAWTLYEKSDDVKALTKAAEWMKKEFAKDPSSVQYMFYDTYAALLFKLKKKDEAKTAVNKAIELAKAEEMTEADYQATIDLKKEIEAMK